MLAGPLDRSGVDQASQASPTWGHNADAVGDTGSGSNVGACDGDGDEWAGIADVFAGLKG